MFRLLPKVMCVLLGFGLGCGQPTSSAAGATLTLFAASSLTDAVATLREAFNQAHPDIEVRVAFSGSQVLRLQIEQGAPVDLFLSADTAHMDALTAGGFVSSSQVFAQNQLVVIVPTENPASIHAFAELERAERIVLGTEAVPVGRYAREVLANAANRYGQPFVDRVFERVVSEESNVRLVRAKVALGEADAAIVYRTDALHAEGVVAIAIPGDLAVIADYTIGTVSHGSNLIASNAFLDFLDTDSAHRALTTSGFLVE
jgi:molybdate transport system substrate-binding protein